MAGVKRNLPDLREIHGDVTLAADPKRGDGRTDGDDQQKNNGGGQ